MDAQSLLSRVLAIEDSPPVGDALALDDRLDGTYALTHFSGKTLFQAQKLFAEDSLRYNECLVWMNAAGFQFYVRAAIANCLSPASADDPFAISGLAVAFDWNREHNPEYLLPIAAILAEFCEYVLQDFARFDADPEVFSGLREEYAELRAYFEQLQP